MRRFLCLLIALLLVFAGAAAEEYTDEEGNRFVHLAINGKQATQRFSPDGSPNHEWHYYPDGQLYHEIWYTGGEVSHYSYWYYGTGGADALYIAFNGDGSLRDYTLCAYDENGILQTCSTPEEAGIPASEVVITDAGMNVTFFFDQATCQFACRSMSIHPEDPDITILCIATQGGYRMSETWLKDDQPIRVREYQDSLLISDTWDND